MSRQIGRSEICPRSPTISSSRQFSSPASSSAPLYTELETTTKTQIKPQISSLSLSLSLSLMATDKLTEYERKRLENIRRNDEMIASLKLHARSQELSAASKRHRVQAKVYKTTPDKKPKTESPIVTRRSLRVRRMPPHYSDANDLNGFHESASKASSSPAKEKPSPRKLEPFISMRDAYRGIVSHGALIQTIIGFPKKTQLSPSTEWRFGGGEGSNDHKMDGLVQRTGVVCGNVPVTRKVTSEVYKRMGSLDLRSLALEPENIARVMPGRILVTRFFPADHLKMIVSGNKFGNIAFWDLNSKQEDGDGIYLYYPHTAHVSAISIHPHSLSKIFTSGYDGLIRLMDAEKEVFDLVYSSDDTIYSLSHLPNNAKCFYFSEGDGGLRSWDERARKSLSSLILHKDRINTIDFNADNPNIMATSSTDGTAQIWDLRNVDAHKPKPLKVVNHKRAVHSAYFSPSGRFLATTSIGDEIGLLSGDSFENFSLLKHDNQTGRWISSFRAIWGWDDSSLFIGNMKRGVDVISSARGKAIMTLQSPHMSAIPCRFDAHPCQVGMLAGATSGGQLYVWTPGQVDSSFI
ncbi:uncharacterized protein LOC131157922 [Malania oleifera]|uniref:uncharacterized protein LOC131157922 n=1 Tax=Malania oleifera TaxID=397392 RepID=UPI0025AEA7F7|nr:uncharacterized protein LOC131157922 [Malania oleifera]